MTRIIGGVAGGRRLAVPARGTRPTADRVRESLFSSLDSELLAAGAGWGGLVVLDLFAGSGALGLEALSRGADSAYLVEFDRVAARTLKENCATVGLPGAHVLVRRAEALPALEPPVPAASLVLVDPPYAMAAGEVAGLLARLARAGWIQENARVVVERPARDEQDPLPTGWTTLSRRRFGDTCLWYGRAVGGRLSGEEGS
jgi:16S rRNA (guanine966-N2)-methyltransferase